MQCSFTIFTYLSLGLPLDLECELSAVCISCINMSCEPIVYECLSALVELGLNNTVHIPLATALPFSDGYFGRKKLKAQNLLAD